MQCMQKKRVTHFGPLFLLSAQIFCPLCHFLTKKHFFYHKFALFARQNWRFCFPFVRILLIVAPTCILDIWMLKKKLKKMGVTVFFREYGFHVISNMPVSFFVEFLFSLKVDFSGSRPKYIIGQRWPVVASFCISFLPFQPFSNFAPCQQTAMKVHCGFWA